MIKKIYRSVFIISLICSLETLAVEGDWGYANNTYIKKSLGEDWSLLSRTQFALRDNMSDHFFGFADVGLGYSFYDGWRLDAVYRRVWLEIGDKWRIEDRPLINLTWFGAVSDVRLTNRVRVEFREYRWNKEDDIRLRNEIRLELPWTILPLDLKPYFEEEFFYGTNSEKIEMNWLTGGLYYKPSKKIKLKIGYRWIAIRTGSEWENRNQLVTGFNLFL